MRKNKTPFFSVLFFLLSIQLIYAEIKLPAIVSSNMVLQRNTDVVLWGWADANENISISTSWLNDVLKVRADKNGNWRIVVKTTNSKKAQTIKLKSDTSNIVLDNILFGEVWLCSGQSNMTQPLKGYQGQPTFGGAMAAVKSKNFNLRLFTAERAGSKTPYNDLEKYKSWQEASPETALDFSAVAYFYGQQLQEVLDVPVGMIHVSWGGSSVEAWMSKEVITKFQEVNLDDVDINTGTNRIPTALFNAMINPLIPFTIKGVLWYQGEANRSEPKAYKNLFPAMVKDWRSKWGIGDFPFYYVQIAPFSYGGDENYSKSEDNSAFIREAQLQCLDIIPNSGIAITMDIGAHNYIHPPKKKEVADRLLFNALNQTYGLSNVEYSGPIYESFTKNDGGILLKFKHAESGVFTFDQLTDFEIAGDDKVFYPAEATIKNGKFVFVKSDQVENPVAVRYAWRNWVQGTLYGNSLLPASSFRTDNWDNALRFKE